MRTRGSSNIVGLLLVVAIIAGIYLVVMLSPAYTDNMDVQEAVVSAYNQSNRDDDNLRGFIRDKLRFVGTHKEDDGYGNIKEVQGLGLTDDDIKIDRDTVRNLITIRVDYSREVELKPSHKILILHFHPSKSGPSK